MGCDVCKMILALFLNILPNNLGVGYQKIMQFSIITYSRGKKKLRLKLCQAQV